ncbi:hypothetical protein M5E86_21685 [Blautia wexlerae]|nr:hypothetical protein M5E86_21685 [Blautia wexlerae]
MLSASSLQRIPYRYPRIPRTGIANSTKLIRMQTLITLCEQADAGFSKAVEYAGESGVQVQKRTDIGHGMDIDSGCLTVKQKISKKFSKKQKKNQAGSA